MRSKIYEIIKNSSAYRQITNDILSHNFSHAYLVISSDKLALNALIEELCLSIYCKSGGCGCCAECLKVLKKSKPDMKEANPSGGALKVEDVAEVVADAQLTAFEKGKKVYIIRDMDVLSDKAQNKLLKTLEEPLNNVHFLLTAASQQGVLATVASRAKIISFGAISESELYEALLSEGLDEAAAKTFARSSNGSLTTAMQQSSNTSYFDNVDEIINVLMDLNKSGDVVTHILKPSFQKERLIESLNILELIFHDILFINNKLSILTLQGREKKLKALATKFNSKCVTACLNEITLAKKKIKANCNNINIIDALLISILEVKNRCR